MRPHLHSEKTLSIRGLPEAQADSAVLPFSAHGGNSLYGVYSVSFRSQTVFYNIIYDFLDFVKYFLIFLFNHLDTLWIKWYNTLELYNRVL